MSGSSPSPTTISPVVYSRDFAYPDTSQVDIRMPRAEDSKGHLSTLDFADLLTGPTISFYIGKERKHWILHRKLLSTHSPFFANRPEAEKDTLEYPTDDPAVWSLFIQYLYKSTLPNLSTFPSPLKKYNHAVLLHKLHNLSLRFNIPDLTNLTISHFRQALHAAHLVPDPEELGEMYISSPKDSGMRRLLIAIAARQIMDPEVERDVQAYVGVFEREAGFAVELVREIRRGVGGGVLFEDPNVGGGREVWEEEERR